MPRRRQLLVIFQTVFLDLLGFGLVLPLLPLYAERFGASPLEVTSISASYSLMQFLFVPLWGRLSDRVGRRPILLLSIAAAVVSYTFMGLTGSLLGLFLARLFSGIAGANLSVAQAYIADVTKPEERAKGMGLVGAAFGLGFIFGPFLGGILSVQSPAWLPARMREGASLPFFAAAALAAVNLILAWLWLPETRRAGTRAGTMARPAFSGHALVRALLHPQIGSLIAIGFLSTFAFANMESTFVLWGEHTLGMTAHKAGYLFAWIGVLMVAMQGGLIGLLARRFGEPKLVIAGTAAMAASLLAAPLCRSYAPLLGVLALLAIGSGMAGPSLQSLISRRTGADDQGGMLGVSQSVSSLARVTGPVAAGFVFGRIGPSAPWVQGGVLMALAGVLGLAVLRNARQDGGEGEGAQKAERAQEAEGGAGRMREARSPRSEARAP